MSEIINAAIDVFEKQIQALYTNDYDTFFSLMTPRIQKELTIESFQKAIELFKRIPIDTDAIDQDLSKVLKEGESYEIPEKHVKLVLNKSGRTLCHLVQIDGEWLIDDIYWRITEEHDNQKEKIVLENDASDEEDEEELSDE
ncbi:MAG: hypothetical protein JW776_06365 [Candidatus Lokiarchaeota archaeon]|nr:hypothetical protein [Candidatus Lokiarchaeota archaeon]